MKSEPFNALKVDDLVKRFISIAEEQVEAELIGDFGKMRTLYSKMDAVRSELRARDGDQRTALLPLLNHPNLQVRLKAALSTLALAPDTSRRMLEAIAASNIQPQAMEAGMSLWNLDRGVFRPT